MSGQFFILILVKVRVDSELVVRHFHALTEAENGVGDPSVETLGPNPPKAIEILSKDTEDDDCEYDEETKGRADIVVDEAGKFLNSQD